MFYINKKADFHPPYSDPLNRVIVEPHPNSTSYLKQKLFIDH